ncbi:MAG TPA: peptidylprolyl isomerase, partial [Fervidobacterium sp.]|nr:peptidylprolyl isomerase [Fervidobacterium sp.]
QKETELTIQAVKDKLGVVTEDEIKKYYDENKDDLTTNYTKAETQYVTFETKEEMDNFVALAMEKGISQAATESSVTLSDYTVTPGTFPEEIETEIFNATSTIISFPYNDTYFVFNIKSVQKVDTYDNFKNSAAYSEVVSTLQNQKFSENITKWKEEKKVSFEFQDPVYATWYTALSTEDKDLLNVYKKLYEQLFDENNEVRNDVAVEQKSAFLVVADRIAASTDTTFDPIRQDVTTFEKKVVESVYDQTKGSSQEILRRMKDYYPEKKDISFQYYSSLYDMIKPYLSVGGAYYVIDQLYEVYLGFGDLAESTSTDLQIRSDSYYKLYEMNKLLGDPQTAWYYLNELKTIKPDYSINFDSAQKELEDMLAEQQAASLSATETSQETGTTTETQSATTTE